MPELASDVIILALRGLLLASLYLFLFIVVLVIRADTSRDSSMARPRPGLIVLEPDQTGLARGTRIPLRSLSRLGRTASNTIVLDAVYVSARHAEIKRRGKVWLLSDSGSTNGVSLNGVAVQATVPIQAGDVITIGSIELEVDV